MRLLLGGTGPGAPLDPRDFPAQDGLALARPGLCHLQPLRLQPQERLITSLIAVELSLVQFHNPVYHAVQEITVMGNHEKGAPEVL